MNGGRSRSARKLSASLLNGKTSEDIVEIPKVVVDDVDESSGFSSSVVKVLSMQRFYTKSVRKSRESWLQKYTYHRANEEREWRRPLMRKSASSSPQPESPASDQNATALSFNEEQDSSDDITDFQRSCCMPLVLEPSGLLYFCWLVIVSLGVMYSYCAIILFVAFPSIYTENTKVCFGIDYTFDSIFVLDILVQFRTGFLQHGILECRSKKVAANYVRSLGFLVDILAVIPFDLLYLVVGLYPIFRVNRLLKVQRFFLFCDRGEIYSGRPKLFNLLKLILYLLLIIHWIACLYFILSRFEGFGQDEWIHPKLEGKWTEVSMQYLYSLHRSSVIMTTVGTITVPRTFLTMIFGSVTYLCGILIFATIVGNAGGMIVDMRRHRERYLRKLNGMKAYITTHQLSAHLTKRVIQWFDYLWTHKRDMNEDQLFANLNDNFRAEIAIHVNLETLIKVEMFKVCDPGFLHDLVLKLEPTICSPGDFICRQGEKGREMYIVNKGSVEVLDEKGTILATLKAGSHFGEISLLNMQGIGDRRTASVRSVGFTDLFRLSKDDLDEVLEFYPDEKSHMERIATKTYERQQKERNQTKTNDEQNTGDSEIPKDPRDWLAADTATLRRRLSWIEAVNGLKRFASRVKKNSSPYDQTSKNILKEYSEKARKQRGDEDSRRIIQDFVTEVQARDAQTNKRSIESADSFFRNTSSESLISMKLNESLRRYRKTTKRCSYSVAEGTKSGLSADSCSTIFRPRSNTMGPFTPGNAHALLNFQTLETSSTKPTVNYGSLNVGVKPNPGILRKKRAFSETNREPPNMKETKQNKSFVLSHEPLVPMKFKDMVRATMERRRKWFEGEDVQSNKQKPDHQNIIIKDNSLVCTCTENSGSPPDIWIDAPDPSRADSLASPPSSNVLVWEHQMEYPKRLQRPTHDEQETNDKKETLMQGQRCDFAVSRMDERAKEEKQANALINDGYTSETQILVDQNDKSSEGTGSTRKPTMINSVHINVECACSESTSQNISQAHENDAEKKSEDKIQTNTISKEENKTHQDFQKQNLEETYC